MKTNVHNLKGKVAVVIGGTGELCGAMGEGLARAGAETVIVGRNEQKAQARLEKILAEGGNAYFESCEATNKQELEQLLKRVIDKSGQVDILINGAGVNSPRPFLEVDESEFHHIINTNVLGVFLACQVFGQYFVDRFKRESKGASIINLGSMSAVTPLSRVFTYSASKAAVHNLSKNLAREWAPFNVRVNILVPGFFPAEQNRKVLTEDRVASIMNHTPMKRFGNANELVGATLLLADEEASSFITGIELIVDGGFAAMSI
jgi:NAD(P)-dependent dehydrogenase (short-subunit alcohol dehydrogenase family)